ncbi:ABC transporter permease [Comamonas antarctica]|uniref:ABC transporter permease n=1 Tax=Comamonas antarctica TaxID=2743470 RepID=A0A6N1X5X6_9BURK|nr:ABC transporter permease [Comamonas antarctica]QKV54849.1 ABC transporter permease [Comamonas antarctica]
MEETPQPSQSSLAASWTIQRRVIGALLMREVLTRFGRHNIGFLWLFVEPMLFTLGVTVLWTLAGAAHVSDLPIAAFALTGYSSVLLWRNMPNRCIGAIEPNLALMYHRHVKVMDIFAARILLEAAGATISFMVLGLFFTLIGWISPPEDIGKVMFAWLMLGWFGFSLAIFMGALAEQSEVVDKLWHPFSYLLFPLSGAAYMVDALPTAAQELVLYLPMVHGVELLREGYFGSKFKAHYDMGYMAIFCSVLTLLGMAKLREISRKVMPE